MPYEIKEIVRILKNKRDILGLSLRDLSVKTGISPSTLQRYETMETNIPLDKFQIICNVLDLKADELLGDKKNSQNIHLFPSFGSTLGWRRYLLCAALSQYRFQGKEVHSVYPYW